MTEDSNVAKKTTKPRTTRKKSAPKPTVSTAAEDAGVITGPDYEKVENKPEPKSNVQPVQDNVVGSMAAEKKEAPVADPVVVEQKAGLKDGEVAIYSPRHIRPHRMYQIPELKQGFNIMSREHANKWMGLKTDVREATPDEVAKHFGL